MGVPLKVSKMEDQDLQGGGQQNNTLFQFEVFFRAFERFVQNEMGAPRHTHPPAGAAMVGRGQLVVTAREFSDLMKRNDLE